jgi:hypothetical protein
VPLLNNDGFEFSDAINDTEAILGLAHVVTLQIPISSWANKQEQESIATTQNLCPRSKSINRDLSKIARLSSGFKELLQELRSQKYNKLAEVPDIDRVNDIDFSLPWCTWLKWGMPNTTTVTMYIYATGGSGKVEWQTFR